MIKLFFNRPSFLIVIFFSTAWSFASAQSFPGKSSLSWKSSEPWTANQLIQPSYLAQLINSSEGEKPLIFNIGVVENIKSAQNVGPLSKKENMQKFTNMLKGRSQKAFVVIYCGCCPFDKCPNIRPAMTTLNSMGFKNARLLNLPTNIKVDWINKGYPLQKSLE